MAAEQLISHSKIGGHYTMVYHFLFPGNVSSIQDFSGAPTRALKEIVSTSAKDWSRVYGQWTCKSMMRQIKQKHHQGCWHPSHPNGSKWCITLQTRFVSATKKWPTNAAASASLPFDRGDHGFFCGRLEDLHRSLGCVSFLEMAYLKYHICYFKKGKKTH